VPQWRWWSSPTGISREGAQVALVVETTMMVLVGSRVGMSLPFLLGRFRHDPATARAPLVTTISDGVGVLVNFSIATLTPGRQASCSRLRRLAGGPYWFAHECQLKHWVYKRNPWPNLCERAATR